MKILHFIPSVNPESGGPAEGLRQISRIYSEGGLTLEVASLDSPEAAAKVPFPAPVHPLGPAKGTYAYSPHALPWLKKNIGQFDLLVIHAIFNYNAVAGYEVARAAGFDRIKVVEAS